MAMRWWAMPLAACLLAVAFHGAIIGARRMFPKHDPLEHDKGSDDVTIGAHRHEPLERDKGSKDAIPSAHALNQQGYDDPTSRYNALIQQTHKNPDNGVVLDPEDLQVIDLSDEQVKRSDSTHLKEKPKLRRWCCFGHRPLYVASEDNKHTVQMKDGTFVSAFAHTGKPWFIKQMDEHGFVPVDVLATHPNLATVTPAHARVFLARGIFLEQRYSPVNPEGTRLFPEYLMEEKINEVHFETYALLFAQGQDMSREMRRAVGGSMVRAIWFAKALYVFDFLRGKRPTQVGKKCWLRKVETIEGHGPGLVPFAELIYDYLEQNGKMTARGLKSEVFAYEVAYKACILRKFVAVLEVLIPGGPFRIEITTHQQADPLKYAAVRVLETEEDMVKRLMQKGKKRRREHLIRLLTKHAVEKLKAGGDVPEDYEPAVPSAIPAAYNILRQELQRVQGEVPADAVALEVLDEEEERCDPSAPPDPFLTKLTNKVLEEMKELHAAMGSNIEKKKHAFAELSEKWNPDTKRWTWDKRGRKWNLSQPNRTGSAGKEFEALGLEVTMDIAAQVFQFIQEQKAWFFEDPDEDSADE